MAHDTEDPTRSSAADAAGMAADYSARHTYARGYEDGLRAVNCVTAATYAQREKERDAEKARADAAERARDEVGIQLAAAQERLRLAGEVIAALAKAAYVEDYDEATRMAERALRQWDAVPGDTL